jgi:hypothetical protein
VRVCVCEYISNMQDNTDTKATAMLILMLVL